MKNEQNSTPLDELERRIQELLSKRPLAINIVNYLQTIFPETQETPVPKTALSVLNSLVPLCTPTIEPSQAPTNLQLIRNYAEGKLRQIPGVLTIGFHRGSGPIRYLFGDPEHSRHMPRLWHGVDSENALTQKVIGKITPQRDADFGFYIPHRNETHMLNQISRSLASFNQIESHVLPDPMKQQFSKYASEKTLCFQKENVSVLVHPASYQIDGKEQVFFQVDIFCGQTLLLRLDLWPYDPASNHYGDFRMGYYRPIFDFVSTADLLSIDNDLWLSLSPSFLAYFLLGRSHRFSVAPYSQVLTGLLHEIETAVFYPEWRSIQNREGDYDFEGLAIQFAPARYEEIWQQTNRSFDLEADLENLRRRRAEIIAVYLRMMTYDPFLTLAIGNETELLDHTTLGHFLYPVQKPEFFVVLLATMAAELQVNLPPIETLRTNPSEALQLFLPMLSQAYKNQVLANPQATLDNTGPYLLMRALKKQRSWPPNLSISPEAAVWLFDIFADDLCEKPSTPWAPFYPCPRPSSFLPNNPS